jgi:hypothetical protein
LGHDIISLWFDHKFLHDQYRAVSLSLAVSHLCRARKLLRATLL